MIHLQRASAGSGKTYALTGRYIKLLLGEKVKDGSRTGYYRLRSEKEIKHGMQSHILAITFTNKATNEMKQRIIEKLSALAEWDDEHPTRDKNGNVKYPDYMKELAVEFGEPGHPLPYSKISKVSQYAITELLNDYTEFLVSTIDSFFQAVLRSFAYETDLRNNYAVELNDSYIADMGTAATFDDLRDNESKKKVEYWVNKIMNRHISKGNKWNLPARVGSAYKQLMEFLKLIVKEDFIKNREELIAYFTKHSDLIADIRSLEKSLEDSLKKTLNSKLAILCQKAKDEITFINANDLTAVLDRYLPNQLNKIADITDIDNITDKTIGTRYNEEKSPYKKKIRESGDEPHSLELYRQTAEVYQLLDNMLVLKNEYALITANFNYLGLLSLIMTHIERFRLDNNIVQLSDTNSILRKIINEDDTPFIYEKIGTAIDHYLIDEFQDTSQMQWDNMLPLLKESLANHNDNLVIGDAKQSIYRFRNADFSIITTDVQTRFRADQIAIHGTTPQENANWRSAKEVVEFNNHFFPAIIRDNIIELDGTNDRPVADMKELYLNSAQMVMNGDRHGYVEIIGRPKATNGSDEDDNGKLPPMTEVAPLVCELLRRGYQQKEIAVLVRTNKQGVAVIDGLMEYNNSRSEGDPMIDFVSGETLYINRAKSVGIIIAVLEAALQRNIAKMREYEDGNEEEPQAKTEHRESYNRDSDAFINAVNRYRGESPDATIMDAIERYFDGEIQPLSIDELLKEMDNMLLQSQVESIIGSSFISADLRKREAPFIAAFQDKVCDYCENYGSNTAAFLNWWHDNGDNFTIATPEGSDAVNIMTVHKSKGLEFRCVIIPYTDFKYERVRESIWVSPIGTKKMLQESGSDRYADSMFIQNAEILPPWIPMSVNGKLEGTPFEDTLNRCRNRVTIDALNDIYVGFTRAVDELYIFYTPDDNTEKSTNAVIMRYLDIYKNDFVESVRTDCVTHERAAEQEDEDGDTDSEEAAENTDTVYMRYSKGEKPDAATIAKGRKTEQKIGDEKMIESYYVSSTLPSELQFRDAEGADYIDNFDDEENDKRELGTVMHNVMRYLTTFATLDKELDFALLRAHVKGFISTDAIAELRSFIKEKLSQEKPRQWFRDDLTVINERNVVSTKRYGWKRRPDRIIVTPQGDATIIDFKFGKAEERDVQKYNRQVLDYVTMLRATGMYRSVEGWLWFVNLNRTERVC